MFFFTYFMVGIFLKDIFSRDSEKGSSTRKLRNLEQGSKFIFFYTTMVST